MEYIRKIVENGKKEDMERLGELMHELMNEIKDCNKSKYDEIKMEMYEMACGKNINEKIAMDWVSSMKPYSEHWDLSTASEVVHNNGINAKPIDFYVVLNMMYNDYCEAIGDNTEMYIKLANEWLKDPDTKEAKLYEYWKHIAK